MFLEHKKKAKKFITIQDIEELNTKTNARDKLRKSLDP